METFTIGQLAKRTGVSVETIRYYERRGVLQQPPKPTGGIRRYTAEEAGRIRFIKRAQSLGFSLDEISELLSLRMDTTATCDEVRGQAESRIADIEDKMKALRRMKQALEELVSGCRTGEPTSGCPVLRALESEETNDGESGTHLRHNVSQR